MRQFQLPGALRRLFATALIFLEPSNPTRIWDKYYPYLSQDYSFESPNQPQKVLAQTCYAVERYLENMNKSFASYGLTHLCKYKETFVENTRVIADALAAPIPETCIIARKMLNAGQRTAYKCIISHVKQKKAGLFFIDGPGGTGKTFLYCALYAKVRSLNLIVLPTASSGIAASNMPTGRTAHSRFKIPLDSQTSLTCDVGKQSNLATLIKEAALIIWDEASMARRENVRALDLFLKDLCSSSVPFGGKVVVLGGDFRQTVPIVPKKSLQEVIEYSLVSSDLWPLFKRFRLTENVRAKEDPEFAKFLLALGNGELQDEENALVTLPDELGLSSTKWPPTLEDLIQQVYPHISMRQLESTFFEERALLTPRNEDVDLINEKLIDQFYGNVSTYRSFDSIIDDSCNIYPVEFLNTLCPSGMSPHKLVLKENCPVILLRNLDPSIGLCNGTRLLCKKFMPNLILCEISTGFYKGENVFIPRINLRPSGSESYPFQFQRMQFPLKLCFAMTINKLQGQTLREVGVYIREPCFSHGQLYVALSRAKKASSIKVLDEQSLEANHQTPVVRNVVSYTLLKRAGII